MGWFDGWFGSKEEETTEPFTPTVGPEHAGAFPGYGAPYTEVEPEPDGDLPEMRLGLNVREAVRNYSDKLGLDRPGYQEIDGGNNAIANSYYAEQQAYLQMANVARDPARAADSEQAKAIMAWYESDMAESFGKDTTDRMLQMYYPERKKTGAAVALDHYAE